MKKSCCIILALLISLSIFAGCAKTEDTVLENEDDEAISGNSEEINQEYNYSDVFDESGFFEGVTATDYITLPEYKSIDVYKRQGWMCERESSISIHSKSLSVEYLNINAADGRSLNIFFIGILPLSAIVIGGVVWYRRKKR